MHAKVVLIDGRKVFVSLANLTSAAQKKNVEVGVIVENVSTASRVRDLFGWPWVDGVRIVLNYQSVPDLCLDGR